MEDEKKSATAFAELNDDLLGAAVGAAPEERPAKRNTKDDLIDKIEAAGHHPKSVMSSDIRFRLS